MCVAESIEHRVRQWCNAYPTAHLERCRGQVQIEPLCTPPSQSSSPRPLPALEGPTDRVSGYRVVSALRALACDVVAKLGICRTSRVFYQETMRSVPVQRIINLSPSDICTYSFNKWFSLEWLSTAEPLSEREREKRGMNKRILVLQITAFRSI